MHVIDDYIAPDEIAVFINTKRGGIVIKVDASEDAAIRNVSFLKLLSDHYYILTNLSARISRRCTVILKLI